LQNQPEDADMSCLSHSFVSRLGRALVVLTVTALLVLLGENFAQSAEKTWQARVVAVADGDTITVEPVNGGDRTKIRLWGVDAPESKQPFGQTAKGYVTNAALFTEVTISPVDKDRYGRVVAVVTLDDGSVLQENLLRSGLVWVYTAYCKNCSDWKRLERQAVKGKKGLWASDRPVPPWEWRKKNR
jgi:endonuclease YncB( thermonuclease family)